MTGGALQPVARGVAAGRGSTGVGRKGRAAKRAATALGCQPARLLDGRELGEPRLSPGYRPSTLISSVQRAMRVLEAVAGHETAVPAKVLAKEAGLPLGTTYHLLPTLT